MSERWSIRRGDCLEVLRGLPDNSFDGMLSDVPYGLGKREPTPKEMAAYILGDSGLDLGGDFMNADWQIPSVAVWKEIFRVLKPGAPVLAFAGPRTQDLIAIGMRAAGFEVRDCLHWLFAKGFPKALSASKAIDKAVGAKREVVGKRTLTGNAAISTKEKGGTYGVQVGSIPPKEVDVTAPSTELAKLWDGYATNLKPAYEPILLGRKPLDGTVANNIARWGVGALAIDACRLGEHDCSPEEFAAKAKTRTSPNTYGEHNGGGSKMPTRTINRWVDGAKPFGGGAGGKYESVEVSAGRWPANILLDEGAADILDQEVGPRVSGKAVRRHGGGGQIMSGIGDRPYKPKPSLPDLGYLDGKTNPSRFFFCSKVNTKEREAGCESLPKRSAGEMTDREDGSAGLDSPRAGAGRSGGAHNNHPCLKPIALTKWLATLIKPPTDDCTLLVPYCGSGSEMIGALRAGWPSVVGIEKEEEYETIARARLKHWVPEEEEPAGRS